MTAGSGASKETDAFRRTSAFWRASVFRPTRPELSLFQARSQSLLRPLISHLGPYVKQVAPNEKSPTAESGPSRWFLLNVKSSSQSPKYERFGETIRYLTIEKLQQFFDVIENCRHKFMMRMIYAPGCRVGEFVRIHVKHLSFGRNTVYSAAENTKTKQRRVSHVPAGLMNDIKSLLRREGAWPKGA